MNRIFVAPALAFGIGISGDPSTMADLSFAEWQHLWFEDGMPEKESAADVDGDLLRNAIEWYGGSNPLLPNTARVPLAVMDLGPAGDYFSFRIAPDVPVHHGEVQQSSDLRTWTRALGTTQVGVGSDGMRHARMALPSSERRASFYRLAVYPDLTPVLHWRFEANGGLDSVAESTGADVAAVLKNGADLRSGRGGQEALFLDGVDDFAEIPLVPSLAFDDAGGTHSLPYALALWVKLGAGARLDDEDDYYTLVQKGIWTKPPFMQFALRGGAYRGVFFRMANPTGLGTAYETVIPSIDVRDALTGPPGGEGPWRHLAFVREASGDGVLYLDGQEIGRRVGMDHPVDPPAQVPDTGVGESPLRRLWIGRGYHYGGITFQGWIDELAIYTRSLSPQEVSRLTEEEGQVLSSSGWERWEKPDQSAPTVYVAPPPVGDDNHPGTSSEPLASIGKALDLVHQPGETRKRVFIKHGVYREGLIRVPSSTSKRDGGELLITRPGVVMEGEPPGKKPEEAVVISGALAKASSSRQSPLTARYPSWQAAGEGLFRARREGRMEYAQAVFLEGIPLIQVGEVWMLETFGSFWRGAVRLFGNDPDKMPPKSFYHEEALALRVPSNGGAGIRHGEYFTIDNGRGLRVEFQFVEMDGTSFRNSAIPIRYSDGRDFRGRSDGTLDDQKRMILEIMVALGRDRARGLELKPTVEGDIIHLGERRSGTDTFYVLNTGGAPSLASHEYDLYVRLPQGLDPNMPGTKLELAYSPILFWARADGVVIKNIHFRYNNATSVGGLPAVLLHGDDILFEGNRVEYSDYIGLSISHSVMNGLRVPRNRVILVHNAFNHCGNSGLAAQFTVDCRLIENESSYNNWRRFSNSWHAGGLKFVTLPHRMKLIGHTARYNEGPGIWFDGVTLGNRTISHNPSSADALGVHISECVAELNEESGFMYEISRNGVFRDNVSRYNRGRGIYLSCASVCSVERNLVVGNGRGGIQFETNFRYGPRNLFTVPAWHPLAYSFANIQATEFHGCAGNLFWNNILRNNALSDGANHDPEDRRLSALAGWEEDQLPVRFPNQAPPAVTLPKSTKEFGYLPPYHAGYINGNVSDFNILWQGGEAISYGYTTSSYLTFPAQADALTRNRGYLDLRDLDRYSDGAADRTITVNKLRYESGRSVHYVAFPSDEFDFDRSSRVLNGFEFLDRDASPSVREAAEVAGREVAAADGDGDGMYDWWEGLHGLDPLDGDDAAADPDGDGAGNAEEFEVWRAGWAGSVVKFTGLADYQARTDPLYFGDGRDGQPGDLNGDGIPDVWQEWYGGDDEAAREVFGKHGIPDRGPLVDSDRDALPDQWERLHWGDLDQGAGGDADGDGFTNWMEFRLWTLPEDPADPVDKDGDRLPDEWERRFGLSTILTEAPEGAEGDFDGDGYSNLVELLEPTHPAFARHHP